MAHLKNLIESKENSLQLLKATHEQGKKALQEAAVVKHQKIAELENLALRLKNAEQLGEIRSVTDDLKNTRKEHLVALYLDAQNRLIVRETVSVGSLNTTRTHPREVLQPAILASALAFILVHNHPSGSLDPSRDDVEFTRTMARAGELMGISLYDHLIVNHLRSS